MKHYDIAIIGNGIAAAAALITLNQCRQQHPDLAIALIAPHHQKPQHLVGESLPPSVKPLLQQLDLWPAFNQANFAISRNRFTAWESPTLQPNFAPTQAEGFGWCIDRHQFEQIIWQQANNCPIERIASLCKQSRYCNDHNHWQINTDATLASHQQISAKLVLDCTGRAASFAKQQAKNQSNREKCQPMVAACDFLAPQNNEVERTPGVMIEAVTNGWWYSTLLPCGHLAIAYFTLRHLLNKQVSKDNHHWQTLIAQSNYTKQRILTGEFANDSLPKVHDTSSSVLQQTHQQQWLACGDAALALDPLSAHGMSTALWSGQKAALALVAKLTGNNYPLKEYVDSCISNWHLYRKQRTDLYQAAQDFGHSEFWQAFQ